MKSLLFASLVLVLIGPGLMAQAQNDGTFSLVVNGEDGSAPIQETVIKPGSIELVVSSASPNVPYILLYGTQFQPATLDFGVVQVDVANPQIIADGVSPMEFLDLLANTGGAQESAFTFPMGTHLPNGPIGAFQAIGLEPTAPFGVADTATTVVALDEPCDFGTVKYGAGASISSHDVFFASSTGASGPLPGPGDYDMQSINPNQFQQFIGQASSPGDIYREQFPLEAHSNQENTSFEYIETAFGNIYHFEDNQTSEFGFMIDVGAGVPMIEIPGSRMGNGGSATSPWEIEVAVSNDQSMLAAVFDPTSGSDQIFVMKLDGTTFPGGASIVDVTPATAPTTIAEESIRIVNGNCYFIDGTSSGFLYRADLGAPGPAAIVPLPLLGVGLPALTADGELYFHAASQSIFFQGGATSTTEDIFVISNIGAGSETIVNASNFPTATQIELFGDAYDGIDGRVAVSPDGSRVAFVVQTTSTHEDVYWTTTDGLSSAQNLTPDASFDSALDTTLDLNFATNGGVFFFYGTSSSLTDLYHADISGPAPVYTNVTATSGSTTVPFASGGDIDPDGYFTLPDRMFFARDGTLAFGPSVGTSAFNLVGVLYSGANALTPYNITGDEFGTTVPGSGITANGGETASTGTELVFAPTGTMVWFKSSVLPSTTNEDLWAFDASSTAPAFRFGLDANGSTIDNIRPEPSGFLSLFSYESSGDEEVYQAIFTLPGAMQLTDDPTSTTNDITDGSIHYFPAGASCAGFAFARGTTSTTNPTDASIGGYDLAAGSEFTIADVMTNVWLFGVSYP